MKRKAKGPAVHVERLKGKAGSREWREHVERLAGQERLARQRKPFQWVDSREYGMHYNPFFKKGLGLFFGVKGGLDLVEALKRIPGRKGRKMVVVDDGAGQGNALAGIKERLEKLGIGCEAVALAFETSPELEEKVKAGKIDRVVAGPAERFVPKKQVDAVVSYYGSVHYTLEDLKREHLLKFAYSLRKGGLLLVGFDSNRGGRVSAEAVFEERRMQRAIVRAFEKRGFRAGVYQKPRELERSVRQKVPDFMLIVQRTNVFAGKKKP